MLIETFQLIFDALIIGVLGYLFTYKLIQDGELLSYYGKFVNYLENGPIKHDCSGRKNSFFRYISKPLGGCIVCFTGQLSLWVSILYLGYGLKEVVSFVTISMFIAFFLERKLY